MIYAVYKIIADEPRKGYYWGKWSNPIDLAYACFNMAGTGVDDIKIVEYKSPSDVQMFITW